MSLTGGVRHAAAHTPSERNRSVDFLRAAAISVVVVGHWLAMVVSTDDGIDGSNALSYLDWAHPLTWALQVMPVFFLVGGYANGASLSSHHAAGGDTPSWLLSRSARLLRPTSAFLLLLAAASALGGMLGTDQDVVATSAWAASIPLWFLVAYLSLVYLAPLLYACHRRFGFAFAFVMAAVVLALDVARLGFGLPVIGDANFLLVWLVFHQVGLAWRDGTLAPRAGPAAAVGAGGAITLVLLVTVGPYPVSMVGVPGTELQNTSPPSFALLVLGLTQAALALLLDRPLNTYLQRSAAWTVVVALNTVILTMFVWHMSAGVLAAAAVYPTGLLPQPAVDSGAWLLVRLPWVATCAVVLAVLVGVFRRLETRSAGVARGRTVGAAAAGPVELSATTWRMMIGVGMAAVVAGLLAIAVAGPDPGPLPGLSLPGVASYLAGAGLLRMVRGRQVQTG